MNEYFVIGYFFFEKYTPTQKNRTNVLAENVCQNIGQFAPYYRNVGI